MGAALSVARLRQQPQQAPQIDWSNPITQGLAFAFSNGSAAQGFCVSGQVVAPYSGAVGVLTPIGTGAKSTSTSSLAYQLNATRIVGANYSLFAAGSSASNAVTQSAIDDDASGVRKFQFRLASGKVEFIPFNTSGSVTGQPVFATPLTVTDLARGFTMGATASPVRTAAFQNGQLASSAPTNIASPSGDFAIGARKTAAQGWASGGLALVAGWSRTLSDAEMRSLAENPWQLFLAPSNTAQLAAAVGTFASAPASVTASLGWTEADDAHAAIGRITNRAAVAWSESDDAHALAIIETDAGAFAWTEASDVMAITCSVTNRSAMSWTEANDAVSITGSAAAAQPTNVSASIAWAEQDDGFALFMSAATGGAPGYGKQRRKYVVRKGGQLLVFSDPDEAKAALHADDEPEPVKQYPAKKQSKAEPAKPAAPPPPDPEPEQRVNLAELQALAKRQDAEAEYQRLLAQQRYDTLLKLEERLREDEEDDWLLMAAE